jgi:hypothetical protein
MAYEIVAPPGVFASLLPGPKNVRVQWSPYSAASKAGHQVLGYRLFRNTVPTPPGTMIADENTLGPAATQFDDLNEPFQAQNVYYTLVAVEPNDFGARPFGEGGNVPFGA